MTWKKCGIIPPYKLWRLTDKRGRPGLYEGIPVESRRFVNELRSNLPHGFNRIQRGTLQFTAALILGERDVGSRAVESALTKAEKKEFQMEEYRAHSQEGGVRLANA